MKNIHADIQITMDIEVKAWGFQMIIFILIRIKLFKCLVYHHVETILKNRANFRSNVFKSFYCM